MIAGMTTRAHRFMQPRPVAGVPVR